MSNPMPEVGPEVKLVLDMMGNVGVFMHSVLNKDELSPNEKVLFHHFLSKLNVATIKELLAILENKLETAMGPAGALNKSVRVASGGKGKGPAVEKPRTPIIKKKVVPRGVKRPLPAEEETEDAPVTGKDASDTDLVSRGRKLSTVVKKSAVKPRPAKRVLSKPTVISSDASGDEAVSVKEESEKEQSDKEDEMDVEVTPVTGRSGRASKLD